MSFIAGYIAGLEEGGSEYKNEPITITENGIYVPDSGVRWNEVSVDVPQGGAGGGFVEIVKSFDSLAEIQLPDNYKIDVCVDLNYELSLPTPSTTDTGSSVTGVNTFIEEENRFEYESHINLTYVQKPLSQITRIYKDGTFQFALWSGNDLLYEYEQYGGFGIYPDNNSGLSYYVCESRIGLVRKYKTKEVHCVPNGYGNIFSFSMRRDSSQRIQSIEISASAEAKVEHTERRFSDKANGEINKYRPVRYDIISEISGEEVNLSLINRITSSSYYGLASNMITTLGTMDINKAVGGFIISVARYLGYTYYDNFDYNELV